MLKFLSTEAEKEFVAGLVTKLKASLPPDSVAGAGKGATVNRITRQLEKTYETASDYQAERRLGFFRRAAFANHFKWELRNAGYSDEFIDVATEGLVMEMSKAAAKRPAAPGGGGR
ncbi:hypothetical protein [Ramlibacter albus]|uniref:Uncharacterized protein n=1 Tax=Ramlibacter albus TaxID=2079448 RepID=A0A923S1G1_9BURK|nr:hypothetical protein [Ramlibacter albus]MBC5763643.1 hypothetical protein [Ramlibacter albus]